MPRKTPPPFALLAWVALAYATWLGAHWLPLPYSSAEIPVFVSRLWDLQHEIARSGHVPWWTSVFMNGSSEALPYAGDFPLVPWALFAPFVGPLVAGKLVALLAIAASGITMFLLARHLLRSATAATLAGAAYLLHPLLLTRAAGAEHIGVVVFIALLPLSWLFFARLLETGRFADVTGCAITLALMVWTQNKHTAIELPFFAAFAARSLWKDRARPRELRRSLAALALLGGLALLLSAFIVVPSVSELKLLKLFEGDPFDGWQRMYSVQSLGALVHRSADESDYFGLALLAVVVAAALLGRKREDRGLFWLLVAFELVAVTLGFGPATPLFRLVELLPLYRDIRAPEVFFQVPGPFFASLLAGFFVTDVIAPTKLGARQPLVVAALAVVFFVNAWPFEAPVFESNVTPATLAHARALYGALGEEGKRDGGGAGKVFVVSSRCFHALGPSWGGPSFVTEAALEYMAPRGTGRLAVAATESFALRRAYLDLVGVRWVVFDKSDPYAQASGAYTTLAAYRKLFPLDAEDDDFAVFRVPNPHPYVSGYTRAALAYGDPQRLPELAMALANEGYLLVHADGQRIEDATAESVAPYAAIYAPAFPTAPLAGEVLAKTSVLREEQPRLPPRAPRDEAIANLRVTRASAENIDARFEATAPCMAVIDESHYPYWHATLDGRPAEILRVAYGLMGVRVTEGAHDLVLRYEAPRTYRWSAFVSLGTLLALGLASARRRLQKERVDRLR